MNKSQSFHEQLRTLSEGPTGGTGDFTRFVWTLPPFAGQCSEESEPTITCEFDTQGNGTVEVSVTDSNGASSRSEPLALDIESGALIATPPEFGPGPIDAGLPMTLTERPEAGTGPFGPFVWQGLPFSPDCPVSTGANLTCAFPSAGSYTVEVEVTDANGATATSPAEILDVAPALRITSVSLSRPSVDLGQDYAVNATVAGGSGGLSYRWSGNGFICAGAGGPDLECPASQQGSLIWNVSVSDLAGAVVNATAPAITILADPVIIGGVKLAPSTVELGAPVDVSVDVLGGDGNYTVTWGDLPSGCGSRATSFVCLPDRPGAYRVDAVMVDGNGFVVTTWDVLLSVTAPPGRSPPVPTVPAEVGVAALAALAGIAGVWVLARRRRSR